MGRIKDFDYVKTIQEYVEKSFWGKRLNEDKVVKPDTDIIVDKIVSVLKNNQNHFVKFNTRYVFKKILFQNTFVNEIRLIIKFIPTNDRGVKVGGNFDPSNVQVMKTNDGSYKLFGTVIELVQYTPNISKIPRLDAWSVEKSLWHEVMHCYRTYEILLKNNNEYPLSIDKSDNIYANAVNLRKNANSNSSCGRYAKYIADCYYKMNKNEIAAQCNTIHGYIRKHTEININNYKDYIDNLDIKKTYNQIFSVLGILQKVRNKNNEDGERQCVISILRTIFDDNEHTNEYVLKKSINNIKFYLSYINDKMYSAISYSLHYFKRNGVTSEDIIRANLLLGDDIEVPEWK